MHHTLCGPKAANWELITLVTSFVKNQESILLAYLSDYTLLPQSIIPSKSIKKLTKLFLTLTAEHNDKFEMPAICDVAKLLWYDWTIRIMCRIQGIWRTPEPLDGRVPWDSHGTTRRSIA